MVRFAKVLLPVLLLAGVSMPGSAADAISPAGNWKFSFLNQGRMLTPWLVKLQQKDNKWTGEVVSQAQGAPQGLTIDDIKVVGDQLSFNLVLQGNKLSFEGKLPAAKDKKVLGSLLLGAALVPADMEPTKLASLEDPYENAKEILTHGEPGPELFQAALTLFGLAAEKKPTPEETRSWANKAFTAAEAYGARWQREMALKIAQGLANEQAYSPLALEYARKARRLLDPTENVQGQLRVLNVLAQTLEKAGKKDEAASIEKEADALYLKKMPPFAIEKYAGKAKPEQRRVLVELFTGAQCPPCVAADVAFDGLAKTYPATDVVLLQYHLHIPGPDPLTNTATEARQKYYDDEVEGTPALLFNGKVKSKASGGGGLDASKEKYTDYREVIDSMLGQTTPLTLSAEASRKGDKLDIRATAVNVPAPGDKVKLRLFLVEESVRYTGGNQVRFHHHIVRDMPGGPGGLALKDKSGKQEVTVDLKELRDRLNNYLNDFGKKARFPSEARPLDLKYLYVVAVVQNDENKEVLQSVQVKVTE